MSAVATETTHFLFEAKPLWTGQIGSGGVADNTVQTIPLQSASSLDSGDVYVVRINRVDSNGTKTISPATNTEVLYGKLSGTNLINAIRGAEGTAQQWDAGTVVEILFTSIHWNKMIEFLGVEHTATGVHDTTKVAMLAGAQTFAGVKTFTSPVINTGVSGTAILDEDTMVSNSDTKLATQQSIKAYVDAEIAGVGTVARAIQDTDYAGGSSTTSSTYANITGADVSVTLTATSHILITAVIQAYGNPGALTGSVDYTIQLHDGTSAIGTPIAISLHPGNTRVVIPIVHIVASATAGAKTYTVQHKSNNNVLSCTAEIIDMTAVAIPA